MQMKRFRESINRIFCKHKWISIGNIRMFTAYEFGYPVQYICEDLECEKCGKKITESYKQPGCFA